MERLPGMTDMFRMNRRSLIVAGGAAALAATTTGPALPAAASTTGAGTATAAHARRVLGLVNADLGLANPIGLNRLLEASLADYVASAPRDPAAADLNAWLRRRLVSLAGTDSFLDAATKIPQTRELLAFGLLSYSQRQDGRQPKIARGMPVPAVLANLEPDFLPELLRQVEAKTRTSPPFVSGLQSGTDHLTQLFVPADAPGGPGPGHPTNDDIADWIVVLIVVGIVIVTK